MAFYTSEKQAAWFALNELKSKLPALPNRNLTEWGTTIVRFTDTEGGYFYSYHYLTESKLNAEWQPFKPSPQPSKDVAYCHTHPNDAPYSEVDYRLGLGNYPPLNTKCNLYMVTQSGAYCYDGKLDMMYGTENRIRFSTLWGLPFPDLYYKFYGKVL